MCRIVVWLPIVFFLGSCVRDTHRLLQAERVSDKREFKIKRMVAGCCGCEAIYLEEFMENKIVSQFVDEYGCGAGSTTKFLFEYDHSGKYVGAMGLIAVTDSSFAYPATKMERIFFKRMDSIMQVIGKRGKLQYESITGFRLPSIDEHLHPFPIFQKGKPKNR